MANKVNALHVLMIAPELSSFVMRDYDILRKYFKVTLLRYGGRRYLLNYVFNLFKHAGEADLIICWFLGLHSLLASLIAKALRRKVISIMGGYEVAYLPNVGYGWLGSPFRRVVLKLAFSLTDITLAVDNSLKRRALEYGLIKRDKIIVVPTGYDPGKFKPSGAKEDIVLTVAFISKATLRRKGLITFVKAASYLPDVKFVVAGGILEPEALRELKRIAPPNVTFTGYLSEEELIRLYQRAKVYCQLSLHEGLPNALCEAMLCGCVPVGTKVGGIPNAIGDCGFYVPKEDVKATVKAIKLALNSQKGDEARRRIIKFFNLRRRELSLLLIITELLKGRHPVAGCPSS